MHKKLCVGAQLFVHNNLWRKCLFRNRLASSYSTFSDRVYSGSKPRDPRDQPDKRVLPKERLHQFLQGAEEQVRDFPSE
jgi:hypothetical protein